MAKPLSNEPQAWNLQQASECRRGLRLDLELSGRQEPVRQTPALSFPTAFLQKGQVNPTK
jgi:hypothetical protein